MRTLYHPDGNKSVWGVKCKFKSFDADQVDQALSDGWFMSPLDFESGDSNGDGELDIDEARDYCKEHNLETKGLHWKKVIKLAQDHINDN